MHVRAVGSQFPSRTRYLVPGAVRGMIHTGTYRYSYRMCVLCTRNYGWSMVKMVAGGVNGKRATWHRKCCFSGVMPLQVCVSMPLKCSNTM